jgi:hypothetical protein
MQNSTATTALEQGISSPATSEIAEIANDDSTQIQIPTVDDAQNDHEDTTSIASLIERLTSTIQAPSVQPVTSVSPIVRLKLSDEAAYCAFFSDTSVTTKIHYVSDIPQGYVKCNGDNCVVCKAKVKTEKRILFPVFSNGSGAVEVLSVSDTMQPGSLMPQLLPILQKQIATNLDKPPVVAIEKDGQYKFRATLMKPLPLTLYDLATIKRFIVDYKARKFALSDIFVSLSNAEILQRSQILQRKYRIATLLEEDTNDLEDTFAL